MADEGMHMVEVVSNDLKAREKNKMDCTIFDHFTKLRNETESDRINGGIELLKYLLGQSSNDCNSKEFKYAIRRLIRGLGASKTSSRIGFYTTLTVFLIMYPEMSIEELLSIVDSELHPVSSNPKSENADIYMGRILLYGALIRSKVLSKSTDEIQKQVIQGLIKEGKQRSYLSFPSISFFLEFVNQCNSEDIKKLVWPTIETEFGKPWSEQTLDTVYTLLVIKAKYPSIVNQKFWKKHFGIEDTITKESVSNVAKVLLDLPKIVLCHHPVFKVFCENLTSCELISEFWMCIDQKFTKPTKSNEYLAVEILKLLLSNIADKSILPLLLSSNYMQHMLRKFSDNKRHGTDEVLVAFKEVLNLLVSATSSNDTKLKTQIAVLKKLILYPGDLMVEKKTGTKVVQMITGNLSLEGIKKVSKIYRDIIENTIVKEKADAKSETFWTNAERMYAAHLLTRLMGYSVTLTDQEWRLEQLKFLFTHGLCEISNVGVDLASHLKEAFYHGLDHKLPKLNNLRNILSDLVHHLDKHLKNKTLKLRNPLSDEAKTAWEKVMNLIEKLENNSKKAEAVPVFHTMNLHMGLQLFSDPQMAIMAINELQSCYERLVKKSRKSKVGINENEDDEPEWVEVAVDLLLSFYSKNNHLLRSLVGCVFPHICPYVTPTAIHQILAVLDVRNEKGPLVMKDEVDEENSSDSESYDKSEDGSEGDEEPSNDEMECSTDDTESDSNEESLSEDEDETVTDRLRMAVRQALGDASIQTDDEDIDVNEINEEEGKRLNESLSAAFKILRENRQSRSKKQEKSAQVLTHFRIRVIDLIETYLECGPSMAIVLDMILPLFALLEYCIKDPHQKPLQDRIRSCLKKLAAVKKFKDTKNVDEDLLTVILKVLIEKGERTTSVYQEMSDKLAECCTFLVRCAQQADVSTESIVQIYGENLTAFFKRRDCVLSPLLFKSILQLQWEGNWQLALLLVDFAFDSTVRSFRRKHALDFLTVFYHNGRLLHSDTTHSDTRMKMEKKLCKNVISTFQELSNVHNTENEKPVLNNGNEIGKEVKQRYICHLLVLLRNIYTQHLPKAWNWTDIGKALITYRTHVSLAKDTKTACNKLAAQIGISFNVPTKKITHKPNPEANGETKNTTNIKEINLTRENGDTCSHTDSPTLTKSELKKKKKNKSKQKEKQQLKKEARILREKTLSDGFESFNFSAFTLHDEQTEAVSQQNGDSQNDQTSPTSSKKRMPKQTSDGNKSKRRKSMQTP
ncbi:PREDICTED: DNA polymerase V [Dufourea novaeangliae]|uniref:Myb-binding protein 1A-like protein n=1 Tax=Dufourea novaeangliae TaxID=178035 RepID=A0A154PTV4_DUFNO|nr:PREDICTED: DNA polymerase V [Dufourea novaeangliae]KZC14630.1 Myb-binding protein 1A-like protein [Dufourea novaeangliae]